MNDAPRRTLRELLARHGPGLCSDARRCEGLLRDLCGGHRREVNVLVGALRERVPLDLLAGRNSVPAGLLLTRLSKRLEEGLALTEEASRWAVDSWALALGVVTDAELKEFVSGRQAAPVPEAAPSAPKRTAGEGAEARHSATSPGTSRPPASARNPPAPMPPATRTAARGGAVATAHTHRPSAAQKPATPTVSSQTGGAGGVPATAAEPAPRPGRGWGRRGCLAGCVLLLLLLVTLAGAPFVINLLREEQLQRSPAPAPGQTR